MLTEEQIGRAGDLRLQDYLHAKANLAKAKADLERYANDPNDDGEQWFNAKDTVDDYEFTIEAFEQVVKA